MDQQEMYYLEDQHKRFLKNCELACTRDGLVCQCGNKEYVQFFFAGAGILPVSAGCKKCGSIYVTGLDSIVGETKWRQSHGPATVNPEEL